MVGGHIRGPELTGARRQLPQLTLGGEWSVLEHQTNQLIRDIGRDVSHEQLMVEEGFEAASRQAWAE